MYGNPHIKCPVFGRFSGSYPEGRPGGPTVGFETSESRKALRDGKNNEVKLANISGIIEYN